MEEDLEKVSSEDSMSPDIVNEIKTAVATYRGLFGSDLFTDVTFVVKGIEYRAHKVILAARYEYFRNLFTNELKETKTSIVEVTDVDYDVFKIIMEFIYRGEISNAPEKLAPHAKNLIVAADKYRIDGLLKKCENFIARHQLGTENAVSLFILANKHNASHLKEKAYEFITRNLDKVKKTEGWFQGKDQLITISDLFALSPPKRQKLRE